MIRPQVSTFTSADAYATLVALLEQPNAQLDVMAEFSGFTGGTTIGRIRKENQDRYLVAEVTPRRKENGFRIALLADGVGSLPRSGIAASYAIAAMVLELAELADTSEHPVQWFQNLGEAAKRANNRVLQYVGEEGASTLSIIVLPRRASNPIAFHLGDSKIYGGTWESSFEQLSHDQTVGAQLRALGAPSSEEAGRDPRSDRALAQYIGMSGDLVPQIFEIEPMWKSIFLSSDGFTDALKSLTPLGWKQLAATSKDNSDFIRKLLFLSNWFGGHDNCTAVLVPMDRAEILSLTDVPSVRASTGSKTANIVWQVAAPCVPEKIDLSTENDRRSKKKSRRQKVSDALKKQTSKFSSSSGEPEKENKNVPSITFLPGLTKDPNVISDSR